ncbi:zinc finger protein 813-like [Uloborus diversus]|uniref:zinc finger protein 813-like n=1 Tax=Uloborus diversus TaxID=327109 RepID=UPI00240A4DD9|nr:zinc finger protein 813-like [Uloborus diversus]
MSDIQEGKPSTYCMIIRGNDFSTNVFSFFHHCPECPYATNSKNDLCSHMVTHYGGRPYECSFCFRIFKRKDHLKRHFVSHTGERRFSCALCGKKYIRRDHLQTHLTSSHGQSAYDMNNLILVNDFNQEAQTIKERTINSMNIPTPFQFRINFLFLYKLIKILDCVTHCENNIAPSNLLYSCHEVSHPQGSSRMYDLTVERSHYCDICSKYFKQRRYLLRHLLIHSTKSKFQCAYCYKTFNRKDNLQTHLRVRHSYEDYWLKGPTLALGGAEYSLCCVEIVPQILLHLCPKCPYTTTFPERLTTHMRIHSGERPYECNLCPMSFKQSHHLTQHLQTHTEERNFQCSECKKTYSRKDSLKRHFHTQHSST